MKTLLLATLLLLSSLNSGCAIYHHYGEFTGKIIDADTKVPLEGAAVLAVYYTELYTLGGTVGKYLDAQETVADKNGEFKISSNNTFAFRPLNLFDSDVTFTIFNPGYGYYPMHPKVWPMFVPNGSLPPNKYVTIELPKLKAGEMFSDPSEDYRIPYEKKKRFIKVLNVWRKQIGADLLPEKQVDWR